MRMPKLFGARRRGLVLLVAAFAAPAFSPRAQAAFHLWNLNEIYSNSSGSLQFIELSCSTANKKYLIGTAGIQAAGAPAPDVIVPNGFLFAAGGFISFFGANSGAYTAIPTNGSLSRTWTGGDAVNSPTNYAGQSGLIVIPEPATLGLATGAVVCLLRRRRGAAL